MHQVQHRRAHAALVLPFHCHGTETIYVSRGVGSTETLAFAAAMVFDLQVGRLLKQPAGWNGVISTLLAFSVGAAVLVAIFMQQEKRLEDKMLSS